MHLQRLRHGNLQRVQKTNKIGLARPLPAHSRASSCTPAAATASQQQQAGGAEGQQQSTAWQPLQHVDALVVDGTNLFNISRAESKRYRLTGHTTSDVFAAYLTFLATYTQATQTYVVFDHPNRRSTQSIRSAIDPNYLAKRRAKQQRTNDTNGGASEHTALEVEARRVGAVALTAPQGYEGDDVIAGVVDAVTRCCQPPPHIVLVSADKDMQQLLAPNVAWLEPLPSPTRRAPCPYILHTADEFAASNRFAPASYVHYLALVGKPDAGVRGTGVSDRTARKLLQRYASIPGIRAAAQAGELRAANFPAEVCAMFSAAPPAAPGAGWPTPDLADQERPKGPAERLARALSNLRLLLLRPEALPLPPQDLLQPLLHRARTLQALAMAHVPSEAAALQYPPHRLHQETCQPYIARLLRAAAALKLPIISPNLTAAGSVVDLLLLPRPAQLPAEFADDSMANPNCGTLPALQKPVAVVVLGPADFKALDSQLGVPLLEAHRQWAARIRRSHLLQIPKVHLVGSTLSRLQTLRHETSQHLRVAPFFEVPESEPECCQYLLQLLGDELPSSARQGSNSTGAVAQL